MMKKFLMPKASYESMAALLMVCLQFARPAFCQSISTRNAIEINPSNTSITLLNMMKVEPANYSKLLSFLKEGIDQSLSKQKGFMGAAIQCNHDKNLVIVYEQWEKRGDMENLRKVPEIQVYF